MNSGLLQAYRPRRLDCAILYHPVEKAWNFSHISPTGDIFHHVSPSHVMGYGDVMVMEKNNSINRCHSIGCQNVWLSECRRQGVRGAGERPLSHTDVLSTNLSVREFKIRGIVGWVENAAVHRSCCLSSSCRHSWAFPSMLVWERPWRIQSELLMQWLFRHNSSVHHLTCVLKEGNLGIISSSFVRTDKTLSALQE